MHGELHLDDSITLDTAVCVIAAQLSGEIPIQCYTSWHGGWKERFKIPTRPVAKNKMDLIPISLIMSGCKH
jgi:hypothetical protein